MSKIKIYGGKELNGTIQISGAKNAALPILCASLLNKGSTTLKNIPKITDIEQLLLIFSYLGVKYTWNETLTIHPENITYKSLLIDDVSKFRASYYLIGVFLSLFGKCEIKHPGGCNLGPRPLDYHINAFAKMGYEVTEIADVLKITKKKLNQNVCIKLPKPSVGATINILLASCKTGICLENYAKEPEVIDTIDFLNKIGYNIILNKRLYVFEGDARKNLTYEIIPDRIETLTYVIMALLCGNITLTNTKLLHIDKVIRELILNNSNIIIKKNSLVIQKSKVEPFDFETEVYPGIPTDIQPLLSVLFLHNHGNAMIKDDIFPNRFKALEELQKLGGKIEINPPYAKLNYSILTGGKIQAPDLRATAALIVSALATQSVTTINNYEIVHRGYPNIEENLKTLGAKFEVID